MSALLGAYVRHWFATVALLHPVKCVPLTGSFAYCTVFAAFYAASACLGLQHRAIEHALFGPFADWAFVAVCFPKPVGFRWMLVSITVDLTVLVTGFFPSLFPDLYADHRLALASVEFAYCIFYSSRFTFNTFRQNK